jgi:hypothetical protein
MMSPPFGSVGNLWRQAASWARLRIAPLDRGVRAKFNHYNYTIQALDSRFFPFAAAERSCTTARAYF